MLEKGGKGGEKKGKEKGLRCVRNFRGGRERGEGRKRILLLL